VYSLHYANELLVRVGLSFQKLCKPAQYAETIRQNVWEKSSDYNKPHFDLFFTTISPSNKSVCFFSERELKKALRETLSRAAWYGLLSTMAD